MRTKRRIEVTVETERVLRLCGRAVVVLTRCDACAQDVAMVRAEHAAAICRVSVRAIYRAVEDARLHHAETPDGYVLVCLDSLLMFRDSVERGRLP